MDGKDDQQPTVSVEGLRAAKQRQQRLATALRENLRKRKTQKRARAGASGTPPVVQRGDGDTE
jgi:hypothetical protein